MKELTNRQKMVLDFITSYIQQNGYSPSIRDIAKHFKLTPRGAHIHVLALEKKGYITRNPKNSRSISLVKRPETVSIPVKGKISAGQGIEMFELVDEEIEIPVRMINGYGNYFALRVEGTSMIEAHIIDGDYVILKKQYRIPNGQIAAVVFDNKVTLKRFYHKNDKVELVPENSSMSPIICDAKDVKVIGKLVGVIRIY
ncbi:LexA repressor [Thermosipho africanus H17ap60334]|jgi:repressor LexA|uniref:LexA repressor n=1 Tax=Thermosipho africanus (strain TCF52B) TaxID=484019 RepID=LEXA_THEAB|nr:MULTISPECIES: transcriptional repressor LexA [Thermosipho]B7IDD1.1 RecName: Full=LexA repressor [Thermosipho africanus TCF52B]ACJ76008.1 LexA repressor [Thermosipho africanus TCF52B]EKF49572.1 LexA repressor [Thermosipho africanus H17ap60334]MBZ4650498.1 lexA [Thermosipho sp. (in: thermotogales)]MDK2839776.1 repressor LexA [Thermosipho sp. (in: thermotogales)]MDK2899999.1 repressor LexA [Thermosipho sp. (in: thermotogales)]